MKTILITGGAGFIGANAALRFAGKGWRVVVLDNLSRHGSESNLSWLQSQIDLQFELADVRDYGALERIVRTEKPEVVLHLAAQVAVTTSLIAPHEDFDINARGTINLLEALRRHSPDSFFIYASTNKVYGEMSDAEIEMRDGRYALKAYENGVDELQPADFCSPYGCSKGTADRYTSEYARSYGLKTVIFRQSCVYGPRQFGCNDQGWVAWFAIAAVLGQKITIYGDGRQSRDILMVDDLLNAYEAAIERKNSVTGQIFNIGGGMNNVISLLDLLTILEKHLNRPIEIAWENWRHGDQRAFSSDITKAGRLLDWQPEVTVEKGLKSLFQWVSEDIGRNLNSNAAAK